MQNRKSWFTRIAVVTTIPLAALGLAGCDTSGSEEGADVEDVVEESEPTDEEPYVYDGVYDESFYEEYETYLGEEVTVSADVNEIIADGAFTIAGTAETTVDPLLIVGATAEVEEGEAVQVTGTVQEAFDLPTVEGDLELELEDGLFNDFDGENYIEASSVVPIDDE